MSALLQSVDRSPRLSAAVTCANMNMRVFPLRPNQKEPATRRGFHDATVDFDQIHEWWDQNPDYNVGVCPWPDIAVVDVDVSGGKPGRATLDKLIGELGPLPPTWIAETATGGLHLWLRVGDTSRVRASLGAGIDVKIGRTGYLVAPPSRREMGAYQWRNAEACGLPPGLPADAPETWRQAIIKPPPPPRTPIESPAPAGHNPHWVNGAVTGLLDELAAAIPGDSEYGRRPTLFRVACRIYGFAKSGHVDAAAATDAMKQLALEAGLDDDDIDRHLRNAYTAADPLDVPPATDTPTAYTIDPKDLQS